MLHLVEVHRRVDPANVRGWFYWRKAAANPKAGNPISQDMYELSVDHPLPLPNLDSAIRRRLRARNRIKASSDIDTACGSTNTNRRTSGLKFQKDQSG